MLLCELKVLFSDSSFHLYRANLTIQFDRKAASAQMQIAQKIGVHR